MIQERASARRRRCTRVSRLSGLFVVAACGSSSVPTGTPVPGLDGSVTPDGTVVPGRDAAAPEASADQGAPTDGAASGDANAEAGAPVDLGPGGDFKAYAGSAAATLQALYDGSTGLWPSTGWWNSANALTAIIDYSMASGTSTYTGDVATTFSKNSGQSFLNTFYDDEGWWALAWIRAYDLTNDATYLSMAKTIFQDMSGGWDSTCSGGIWWSKAKTYKNAIANELFLEVASRLHLRTPGDGGAGSFLDWAQREWSWFDQSGMINAGNLVNDGLASCKNNGQQTWTYNQGVIVGGLVDLSKSTGDLSLLTRASAIATAAMKKLVNAYGVLVEPCEPSCGGDGPQFKGIFMRHLGELQAATGDAAMQAFLAVNADWIWNADRGPGDDLGLVWSGAFDSADGSRQSSALDALNAAIPFSLPEKNLALSAAATANGSCAATQGADKAFDGLVTTKWCSGATNGAYWLTVDLGAPVTIGRIIVRHAQAGGESAAWNTRDFSLSTDDASPKTVLASVTGNTHGVTIHRFTEITAQRVRLDITAPQTDPSTVAARIDELEVYAR